MRGKAETEGYTIRGPGFLATSVVTGATESASQIVPIQTHTLVWEWGFSIDSCEPCEHSV